MNIDISQSEEIFTVSRLNREVRFLLEGSFPPLWVEGEISNFVAPNSGHWYFSLKDETAQVRCAMFKPQNRRLTFTPKDGMHVFLKARVTLYEGRGEFQLLVELMEEAGVGKLQKEFDALKKRLSDAGLFSTAHKKLLPSIPKRIGVITSPTGAAIRDILHILKRRFSCAPVIIYPTLVQGELAAANIVSAIKTANQRNECDVLILARGGGSIEDLWPFNEEKVAHAIFQSIIPIISGVGHEIDFTIADFVADVRAPTPSAAAELLTPDCNELLAAINQIKNQFTRLFKQNLLHLHKHLNWMTKHLQQQHPKRKLLEQAQRLDYYESTLARLQLKLISDVQAKCHTFSAKLKGLTPRHQIHQLLQYLLSQKQNLLNLMTTELQTNEQSFLTVAAKLETLSPLATLKRGFAIATKSDNTILRSNTQVKMGERISIQLMEGHLGCIVDKT